VIERNLKHQHNKHSFRINILSKDWKNLVGLPLLLWLMILLIACNREQQKSLVYPEADSEQALLYVSKCGECHAAPLTTAHTAEMWVPVIDRMQYRMISKKIFPLNEDDKAIILKYLQKHAKKDKI